MGSEALLEHIKHVRQAIAGLKSARTKCSTIGPSPENRARIQKLEAMRVELEQTLRDLRRALHEATREARA